MSEKERALTAALTQIERSYGKGAIMKLGEAAAQRNIDVIPTGSLTLDMALGVGGIPRGRVVEIYGPESSGKTTLALHVIAQSQKLGNAELFHLHPIGIADHAAQEIGRAARHIRQGRTQQPAGAGLRHRQRTPAAAQSLA